MKQSRPVGVREIGEVFGPSPEWDTIRRPFLPWGITRTLSIDEVNVLRRLDLWERTFRNLRERVKNSKLRKVLHGESIEFRRNKLAHLVNHHPIPCLGTLSNSLLRTGGPSNQLFKAFGSYFGRNIASTTENGPYKRNIEQEDEILLKTPSSIHGFDLHSNYSFIRTSQTAFIIDQDSQEKLSAFKTQVSMTDLISLNTDLKTAVSTEDGVVTLYDASVPYAKFDVYPKGENFGREWNVTRTMSDVIVSAGRNSLYIIVPSQKDIVSLAKEALPKDYISDVLVSSNEKDFFVISRSTLNVYDARKLKSPLLSWAHGMENLPAAGGDILHQNGVDYCSIYNRDGEVFLWAYDNVNIRGLPRRFSPLHDILNYTPFDEEATYQRASCPWTGIQLLAPGKKKKYLYAVTTNAMGDLFCMEIKKSGVEENQDFDWLLESRYREEEVEILENFENKCRESFYVKKSTCCKLFVRKDHSRSFDTKWSFPKIEANIVKSSKNLQLEIEEETLNLSKTRNKADRNPFKNFESLKLLDYRTCGDRESQRIRKILKRKPVFDDIPSDTESDSTFCTESVKTRSTRSDSNASNSGLDDNNDLPKEVDNMLGQFFNDLDPNMTSTQERGGETFQGVDEEEMMPLTVGTQSEFSEFQSLSQVVDSRSFLSAKKKKRKSKVMGF